MHTFEANKIAVGGHSKAVCLALRRLGMRRCSERLIRYQCERNQTRADWYSTFWRWFRALWVAHREGAEFLYEDFQARVATLRGAEAPPPRSWLEQVARCEQEHSEALRAAILAGDSIALRSEVADVIREYRSLLAMIENEPLAVGRAA
jgi:hypothetical protein